MMSNLKDYNSLSALSSNAVLVLQNAKIDLCNYKIDHYMDNL